MHRAIWGVNGLLLDPQPRCAPEFAQLRFPDIYWCWAVGPVGAAAPTWCLSFVRRPFWIRWSGMRTHAALDSSHLAPLQKSSRAAVDSAKSAAQPAGTPFCPSAIQTCLSRRETK